MTNARLRYGNHEIALPAGPFVIGRGPTCHLVLDDTYVSRRHATIVSSDLGLTVEDLGSRAGVSVNRRRISGVVPLHHGDVLGIAQYSLRVVVGTPLDREETLRDMQRDFSTAERPAVPRPDASAAPPSDGRLPPSAEVTHPSTLLQEVALRALFVAEPDAIADAEWAVTALCRILADSIAAGGPTDPQLLDLTSRFLIRLAEVTRSPAWSRELFGLNGAARRILPEGLLSAVEAAAIEGVPLEGLPDYLATLRALPPLDPEGARKLERLERLIR